LTNRQVDGIFYLIITPLSWLLRSWQGGAEMVYKQKIYKDPTVEMYAVGIFFAAESDTLSINAPLPIGRQRCTSCEVSL